MKGKVSAKTVMVVDDERALADTLAAILVLAGYQTIRSYSGGEAVAALQSCEPALIITDVIMPGMNGIELARKARELYPHVKILLMSGNAVTQDILDAAGLNEKALEIVAKPVPPRQMINIVASLIEDQT